MRLNKFYTYINTKRLPLLQRNAGGEVALYLVPYRKEKSVCKYLLMFALTANRCLLHFDSLHEINQITLSEY